MEENELNITATETAQTVENGAQMQSDADYQPRQPRTERAEAGVDSPFADLAGKWQGGGDLQQPAEAQQALYPYRGESSLQQAGGYPYSREKGEEGRISQLENRLKFYHQREVDRLMAQDLREIQSRDPTVTSLDDLPGVYFALRFSRDADMTATEAFLAARAVLRQAKQPKPASTGSVGGAGTTESEFFTGEELNRLNKKQLSDPEIMEKAMRSIRTLK